jgi:hypothetical protein
LWCSTRFRSDNVFCSFRVLKSYTSMATSTFDNCLPSTCEVEERSRTTSWEDDGRKSSRVSSVNVNENRKFSIYDPITLYWTGLLILDHSYLVGNLTNSKIAETNALEPLKSWHFCISNFRTC